MAVITSTAYSPPRLHFKHFCLLIDSVFQTLVGNFHSKRVLTVVNAFSMNYSKGKIAAITDARIHPLPCRWCSCGCTGARAKFVQPRAQGLAGAPWLPTPAPAAALPPPDTHPCPFLVLPMLLGANIELVASGNPGKSDPLFWASWCSPRSARSAKSLSGTRGALC